MEFERLMTDLKDVYSHGRKLKNYINSVIFWALDDTHLFKLSTCAEFGVNLHDTNTIEIRINPTQKLNKMSNIFRVNLNLENLSKVFLRDFFSQIFKTVRGAEGRYVKIIGLNPNNFEGQPLTYITNDDGSLLDLLYLPNSEL